MPRLKLHFKEVQLLALAINYSKPTVNYTEEERDALKPLARKIACYLAEPNYRASPKPPKPKHPKKLIGFAAVRPESKELQRLYASMNDTIKAAAAANPAPLE